MQYITSKQMTRVDELAIKKYNLSILQMMENAGRNLALFTTKFKPKTIFVLYGKGNNGGGGLVAARHLAIKKYKVKIIPAEKTTNKNVKHHLKTLAKMKIKPQTNFSPSSKDVILDCLLGYNIKGAPSKPYAKLIEKANKSKVKIISLDLPSGLNPNTGLPSEPTIKAHAVLTLALPKTGLKKLKNVYLANIGIPNKLYKLLNLKVPDYFTKKDVIKIS